jgi:uncharacterized membrane protein HdeD (DUF308 family)
MGILMIVMGMFCLSNPFAASLSVQVLAAIGFFLAGIMNIMMGIRNQEDTGMTRFMTVLLGIVLIYLAISLVKNPLAGLISLTLAVALLILAMGVVRIMIALGMRPMQGWIWILISGIVSVLLAVMVFMNMPEIAIGFLGILLGIDLIMSGVSSVFMAFALRSQD